MPNLSRAINDAMKAQGVSCKLAVDTVDVVFPWPAFVHDNFNCDCYQDEVGRIPGVQGDSGTQYEGYCFEIDLKRFTPLGRAVVARWEAAD